MDWMNYILMGLRNSSPAGAMLPPPESIPVPEQASGGPKRRRTFPTPVTPPTQGYEMLPEEVSSKVQGSVSQTVPSAPSPASAPAGIQDSTPGPMDAYMSQMPQWMELAGMDDEAQNLVEQQAIAQRLADTQMPEGRQAGRVYVSANPLEFLGAGMQAYGGMKDVGALQRQLKELRKKQTGLRGTVAQEMAKYLGNGSPKKQYPGLEDIDIGL